MYFILDTDDDSCIGFGRTLQEAEDSYRNAGGNASMSRREFFRAERIQVALQEVAVTKLVETGKTKPKTKPKTNANTKV